MSSAAKSRFRQSYGLGARSKSFGRPSGIKSLAALPRQSYALFAAKIWFKAHGAHCAVLHPWFLAVAWYKLYGFPWDVRLWASFCLHDIGYISKPNMDGCEGETHVELGARIMGLLFGESWAAFTAAHSRYWAKRNGRQFSRLCVADKLAFVLTPAWLYLPMTRATGELSEYMLRAKERQAGSEHFTDYESTRLNSADAREWLEGLKSYTRRWIEEHRNGGADNWTVGACAESTAAFR